MIITFTSLLKRANTHFLVIFIKVFELIIVYNLFANRTFLPFKRSRFIIVKTLLTRVIDYYYVKLS